MLKSKTMTEQEKKIIELAQQILRFPPHEEENIKLDSYVINHLGMDSLDKIEFVMKLEKEFNIMIPDFRIEEANTLKDFNALVTEYVNAKTR